MTTAQDQQSRAGLLPCPFCGGNAAFDQHDDECYFRKYEAQRRAVDDADLTAAFEMLAAWNRRAPGEQAARALPAGMEPVGWVDDGAQVFWKDSPPEDGVDLFTAAQVQAMGRVPPATKVSRAHEFRPNKKYP